MKLKNCLMKKLSNIISEDLSNIESKIYNIEIKPTKPIVFIVGPLRSGTTLLYQILSATTKFMYINNILAPSWKFPVMAASIFKHNNLLYDYRNFTQVSNFGVTEHPLDPHEFGYFWKRWLPISFNDEDDKESIINKNNNTNKFISCLGALEKITGKPLL